MRSILDELNQELEELRNFVSSLSLVKDALASHALPSIRGFAALRKRFDNAAFVVALYASFEKYVEELVAALATLEAKRLPYTNLPQKLLNKHLQRSAELLSRGRLGEGRHAGLTPSGVVANLYNCLHGVTPYSLNTAAVVWHDANLRSKDVNEMFHSLGIDCICTSVRRGDNLTSWYVKIQNLNSAVADGVPARVIEERLNDLVERRNQVAHRGGNPENLLGTEAMTDAIEFIGALASDIFSIVASSYLESHYVSDAVVTKLVQIPDDGPYRNGTVIIVAPPAFALFVGQPIFVIRTNGAARWGRIQSLQLNDTALETVAAGEATGQSIGVALDFVCSADSSPIVLDTADDLVWIPK